ncbi:MAG: TRAP transporter small permease subunit [Acuticoccus sp.]
MWSSASKTFFTPSLWTLESAQFALAAYYMLGGAYAMQQGGHVRMDLFYCEWSPRTKALIDSVTVLFLIFFLTVLLLGGINSTAYSLQYSERSATAWRPLMWPIKTIMCTGIVLMLLQALAELLKDVARIRGREI